jgi:tetratricopeptide (TPR) repeat protein
MMLQENGKFKEAIIYLLQALKCYDNLLGPNHIQTAAMYSFVVDQIQFLCRYHAIAIAYSQLGQYKEALAFEKKNYSILHAKVGDTDIRAIESNICLKQFTQKAVQVQVRKYFGMEG